MGKKKNTQIDKCWFIFFAARRPSSVTSISERVGFHFLSEPASPRLNKPLCKHNSRGDRWDDKFQFHFREWLDSVVRRQVGTVEGSPFKPLQRVRDRRREEVCPAAIREISLSPSRLCRSSFSMPRNILRPHLVSRSTCSIPGLLNTDLPVSSG